MKKILFVHDHLFYDLNGKIYSSGGLSRTVWERFENFYDEIEVIARGKKISEPVPGLVETEHKKVKFNLLYEVSGGKDYYTKADIIKNKLEKSVIKSDRVVIRLPSSIGLYCVEICKKHKIKYVSEVVGCIWDSTWNYGSLLGKIIAPYLYFKTKKAIRNSLACMYVTQFFLQKRYPNSSNLNIYASNVIIDDFEQSVLENHINLLNSEKNSLNLGLIGFLNAKYKGFDVAIKALRNVIDQSGLNIKLYIVGGGDDKYVKGLIKQYNLDENVIIVGRLKAGEEVFRFLDTLDIYIHPSKQEGLPRSVIEAMGRGCPVLASSIAGIPELLDNEFLHKPGDYNKLSEQIISIIKDKNQLIEMSKKNFSKSKEYTNEILTERRFNYWSKISKIEN